MAPASDNNNQDLATKKAKLDSNTVLGGVGKFFFFFSFISFCSFINFKSNFFFCFFVFFVFYK